MISIPPPRRDEPPSLGANLRRLMARYDLTFDEVVDASGLDTRTVRGIITGRSQPHAHTLHKLARGLGVDVDELFFPASHSAAGLFDRLTNALVDAVIADHPERFDHWSDAQFDELYSRFGTGGQLTETGILAAADAMNAKQRLWNQISVILESSDAQLLTGLVELFYRRVTNSNHNGK